MRKTTLLWASVCLLLSGAFRPLDAAPEREDEEDADSTGQCEAFMYEGCGGNQNRFKSQEACRERCIAGDTEAQTWINDDSAQPTASSTPRPAKRKAEVWGRPGFCFLDADMGPCSTNIKRYFHNHHFGRCEEFMYGGCKGNLNNFETEADCQRSCGDPDDSAQPSASSTPRPAKRKAEVWGRPGFCFLDADKGPCSTNIKRYFHNHRSGRCEEFVYGGCKGNLNNFETKADCQRSCGDPDDSTQPTASSTPLPAKRNAEVWGRLGFCFLDADMGPCSANIRHYFYNHRSGRCEEFVYGGCKGNLNNFETEADCQRSCGDPDDSAQPTASSTPRPAKKKAEVWGRPGFCFLDADMGPCSANIKRYFHNHHFGRCEEFMYGGCKGNLNNFETEADCQRSCGDPDDIAQPSASSTPRPAKRKAEVWGRPGFCFLDADMGPCSTNIKRYFHNHRSGRCEEFVYGGCKGNLNNFETEADCQRSCGDPDDSTQPAASSAPRPAKRNAAIWAFTKRTPKGRLMKTKRRKDSVEIGYEIY